MENLFFGWQKFQTQWIDELNRLKNWIFDNCLNEGKMKNRREGNKKIKEECFDKIINVIQQFNENN